MKKYAVLHEPGDIVTLAGTRFVVLDVERRGSLPNIRRAGVVNSQL